MYADREYQKAISYLQGLIERSEITIGARLPTERFIAQELVIGRNSAREALKRLENVGAIECRRGSGYYLVGDVSKPVKSMLDMMMLLKQTNQAEICSFRRNMEKALCTAIMENVNKDSWLEKAQKLLHGFTELPVEKQIEVDREFHYLLINATENAFWIAMMEPVAGLYRRWIESVLKEFKELDKKALDDAHTAIYSALLKGDRVACDKAIDEHYDLIECMMIK